MIIVKLTSFNQLSSSPFFFETATKAINHKNYHIPIYLIKKYIPRTTKSAKKTTKKKKDTKEYNFESISHKRDRLRLSSNNEDQVRSDKSTSSVYISRLGSSSRRNSKQQN